MTKRYDEIVEINPNRNGTYIPNHYLGILITGGFGTGQTIVLLNLT